MNTNKSSTKREKKSLETKINIFNATKTILINSGFKQLTTQKICTLSNTSNGVFFHFFKSKEDLIIQYMHYDYQLYLNDHPFNLVKGNYSKNIISLFLHNIAYCKNLDIELIKIYYSTENQALSSFNPETDDYTPFILAELEQLKDGIATGHFKHDTNLFQLFDDIEFIVKGIIFGWASSNGVLDIEENLERILSTYLKAFENK